MKEEYNNWLTDKMKIGGVLACAIRGPDRKTFTRGNSSQVTPAALEHACRCLADTFHILSSNKFPTGLIRWVYENYFVYGSIREDGYCLAVLTRRGASELQAPDLESIVAQFHTLPT